MKLQTLSLSLACISMVLAGCGITTVYRRPEVAVPERWQYSNDAGNTKAVDVTADWWKRFGSEELNTLVRQALDGNRDFAAALSRIEQARASAQVARSALLPTSTVSVTGTRDASTSSDQPMGSIAYEVDLWGRNAAGLRAAEARVAMSQHDRDAMKLLIQSEVASTYFQILALNARLVIARNNAEAARQSMALIDVLYKSGAVTGLDVAQQRTMLLVIESDIPALMQSLSETQSALALLLGRAPQGFTVSGQSLDELTLPSIDAGTPAMLLNRRPDIQAAEARLIAANADVSAAHAAFFPTVNLSASAATSDLLSSGATTMASLVSSLVGTIFSGGNRSGQLKLSEAARQELVESYGQTVLTSLHEVQNSLAAVDNQQVRAEILTEAAEHAQEMYRLVNVRYLSGAEDLSALIDAQSSLFDAQDSLVQAQLARYIAAVTLFKSLGGGWKSPMSPDG